MLKQRNSHNPSIVSTMSNTASTTNSTRQALPAAQTELESTDNTITSQSQLPVIAPPLSQTEEPVTRNSSVKNNQSTVFNGAEKVINQIRKGSESNPDVKVETVVVVDNNVALKQQDKLG